MIQRIVNVTKCRDMVCFMTNHFHRVGKGIAQRFLEYTGIEASRDPKTLGPDETVKLTQAMKNFPEFLPPDASCLSPLGKELLEAGIRKELNAEFVAVEQRKPSAYSGHPFVVEVGIAYGGGVSNRPGISLYRFANRIPLLYDESSDVAWKVANTRVNWRYYKVTQDMPMGLIVHICSTKIPYKTVGKEFVSDRPEVEREILNGVRDVSRRLSLFLSKKISIEREKKRLDIFSRYLPKIAQFSKELAGKDEEPSIEPLLRSLTLYGAEEE
jgi:DNA topoisomerase-6 subunit B